MSDEYYEIRRAAYEAVAYGDAEIVGADEDGVIFQITDKGRARAEEIIDAAIRGYGEDAAEALAEALDVPLEVGEQLVAMRRENE